MANGIRTLTGSISSSQTFTGAIKGGGTTDHCRLVNRSEPNQHPIEAITGLREELDQRANEENFAATKEALTKAISDEQQRATQAEEALQETLATEIERAQVIEAELTQKLDEEYQNRVAADINLSNRIAVIEELLPQENPPDSPPDVTPKKVLATTEYVEEAIKNTFSYDEDEETLIISF